MIIKNKKIYVDFTCNGTAYVRFDPQRPYFVVENGEIRSCHENYREAANIAPYTGSDVAGKIGGPAMTTSVIGLSKQGIENPIPPTEEEPSPHTEIITSPECISAPWYRDIHGMWKQRSRKKSN